MVVAIIKWVAWFLAAIFLLWYDYEELNSIAKDVNSNSSPKKEIKEND